MNKGSGDSLGRDVHRSMQVSLLWETIIGRQWIHEINVYSVKRTSRAAKVTVWRCTGGRERGGSPSP